MSALPEPIVDFDPNHLPVEILQGIGLAVANYAQLEDLVKSAIAGLLGVDAEYGLALGAHMSAPLRMSVLRSLAELRITDTQELINFEKLVTEIEAATAKRTALAHQSWCIAPSTGAVFQIKETARAGLDVDMKAVDSALVKRDADSIYETSMSLMRFLIRTGLHPAIPPTDRPRMHRTKNPERNVERRAESESPVSSRA